MKSIFVRRPSKTVTNLLRTYSLEHPTNHHAAFRSWHVVLTFQVLDKQWIYKPLHPGRETEKGWNEKANTKQIEKK
jgi:hypothetical protein